MKVAFIISLLAFGVFAHANDLNEAINAKDNSAVETALTNRHYTGEEQASALIHATITKQPLILSRLIDQGFDVNKKDPQRIDATALMYAAYLNDMTTTSMLLDAGAQVNVVDKNGDHALNWAVYAGRIETSSLLLQHGARLDISGHGNAMEIAKRRGFQTLVSLLCEKVECGKSDANAEVEKLRTIDDMTTLSEGQRKQITMLDDTGRPYWHQLVRAGQLNKLKHLKVYIDDINQTDDIGFTALMEAAREGHADIVNWLIAQGADINQRSKSNSLQLSALHLAAIGNCQACVLALLENNAAIDAPDSDGTTPTLWALSEGHKSMAEFLLTKGADKSRKNKDGYSADMFL